MFASSIIAGSRPIVLRTALIIFPLVFLTSCANEWSNPATEAPFIQSGSKFSGWFGKHPEGAQAQERGYSEKGLTPEARATVRNAVSAVGLVMVKNSNEKDLSYRGSAVVVRSDGIIVTNHHVIYDKDSGRLYDSLYLRLHGDKENGGSDALFGLEIITVDRQRDLALLRALDLGRRRSNLNLSSLELGDEKKLELLDDLVVIGYPEKGGSSATLSPGVVEGIDLKGGWIKTDARLLHGNSGGAAVNSEGKLIGIATKVVSDDAENNIRLGMIGYLRAVDLVRQMLEKLPDSGRDTDRSVIPSPAASPSRSRPQESAQKTVPVRGIVRDAVAGGPISGARVGLLIPGGRLNPDNVITWGGTNAEGNFELEKAVFPGIYTLRVRVIGDYDYAPFSKEVEIKPGGFLVVELNSSRKH